MKFMKLGSKSDSFQTDGNNTRYVVSDLAADLVVQVGNVKFYLHKFPLLSKSSRLQKLVSSATEGNGDEINIDEIPGGSSAFELCAMFCYGMIFTLDAYNVVAVRCAAEYLEMYESMDKGNLVYKIDVFLSYSIFKSWKDSIIVLESTKDFLPLSEELKLASHSIDAIASKASTDVSKVDWSYTYNRKKTLKEGGDPEWNGVRSRTIPRDWWVEDLCDLEIDLYTRVIVTIKNKRSMSNQLLGKALKAYAYRRFPVSGKNAMPKNEVSKIRVILDTIIRLLPAEKGTISCSFLLKMLKVSMLVESGESLKAELVKRIGHQLEEASVDDLLISSSEDETMVYNVHLIQKMLQEFMSQDCNEENSKEDNGEIQEINSSHSGILSEASKLIVARVFDGYLTEIAKDPHLPVSLFVSVAEMVSTLPRPTHDNLYRAIDTYLKEHPWISKSERKRICRLMDCKKLSSEACVHAVQNERLPLRIVVQVLFFEQVRASASSGSGSPTPDLPKAIKDLNRGSYGSSHLGTTTTDEDWDAMASAEELQALRSELTVLRVSKHGSNGCEYRNSSAETAPISKVRGLIMSRRILSKIWNSRGAQQTENTGSDSSGSLEAKSTPVRRGRHSVS